jgi:hypothetical protein
MTLGLPEQLARDALRRALQRAAHAAAFVCLSTALVIALAGALGQDRNDAWLAVAALVVMIVALVLVVLKPTVRTTLLYLAVGTVTVLLSTVIVMSGDTPFATSNNVVLAMPRVALVLVGGAGAAAALAITWAALGFALGEAAVFVGTVVVGASWSPNTAAAFALAVIVSILVVDRASRRSRGEAVAAGGAEDELQRADRRARDLALRADQELRATARLHDTALLHLIAIASAGSGPVDERLRAAIRQDLTLIAGPDWALDLPAASESGPRLDQALTAAEHAGIAVHLTGDTATLARVTPERAAALDAAAAQCLVNVSRHAGVDSAEVVIGVGDGALTIAIIDSGTGFDEALVPADRIGLRTSIRGRIEYVGGTVRLWSTEGIGTTVVLSVPLESAG